ncbi:otoancorin [Sceloporus undulatus]|uniref:otoancorin n=1 Tax=Sceloporus undulatus TaxID=8520 RepID=UPI001C4C1DD5|nr:otoancorin [Sceloporus undulatus]
MPPHLRIFFLLALMNQAEAKRHQNINQDLPPQLQKIVEEVTAGKYLNALLDILHYQSTNMWTTELLNKALAYFHAQNVIITYSNIQVSVKNYLENLLYHPKVLLSEFQQMNRQRFETAMKYLFGNKQDYLELGDIVIDLVAIREKILQSPGGNRTLFLITLERCFLTLNPAECVDILSQILRSSSIMYLQVHTILNLPKDLQEDAFRNLSSVFKDLYDRITASSQRALYDWMMRILQKSYNSSDSENFTSWVSAENLWILGRYMVHLPLEEIRKISPYEMRLFISYDNATKQLDTVYDITPDLAQAFLERINASGFDMRNTSTLHRLGLLVCFYNDLLQMEASVARVLLHQMIKCNQLRRFQADIQKLKSQLLDVAMHNQTLNDTLGSLSDAVVGLSTSQLESLSPEAVHNAMPTLNQVSGWAKSQIIILSSKYLMYEKNGSVISEYDIDLIGNLICHLPPTFICEGISLETIVTALHQFRQCQHLSYEQKMEIKHRLIDLYGSPRNWTAETTQDIGPFIALLPKAELNILVEKFPDIISEIASKKSGPVPLSEELLLAYFECVRNTSIPFNAPNLTLDCAKVVPPSSEEIIKLSEANMFWSVEELICMDPGTFSKTVELLGSVCTFNASQLAALKEKAKQVWGPLTSWKNYHIVSLRRIAIALNETEIEALDLSSIDTIAALSEQTEWDPLQARSILQSFLEDSGQAMDALKSFDLAGLGSALCALNATEIAAINATEFSAVVARIGSLPCNASVLEGFKKKAESVFGIATAWDRAVLQEIGTIAAGLNDTELKAIDKELMPYFHPRAIKCIPDEMFKELTPEQIASLGPANAAMVTESQRQHLNELQLQSLEQALDGARRSIDTSPFGESTIKPTYTSVLSGAPFPCSLSLWVLPVFILYLASMALV